MANAAKKTTKKPLATARKRARKGSTKKGKVLRLEDFMPESERLEVLRRAARRIDESGQTQEVLKAVQRMTDAYERLGHQLTERLSGLEHTAEERLGTARERLLELSAFQTVQEMTERMSGRAIEELDEVLDQLGLMRKAVHEDELGLLKKKHKASRKAAETRAKKTAERDLKSELRKKAAEG